MPNKPVKELYYPPQRRSATERCCVMTARAKKCFVVNTNETLLFSAVDAQKAEDLQIAIYN